MPISHRRTPASTSWTRCQGAARPRQGLGRGAAPNPRNGTGRALSQADGTTTTRRAVLTSARQGAGAGDFPRPSVSPSARVTETKPLLLGVGDPLTVTKHPKRPRDLYQWAIRWSDLAAGRASAGACPRRLAAELRGHETGGATSAPNPRARSGVAADGTHWRAIWGAAELQRPSITGPLNHRSYQCGQVSKDYATGGGFGAGAE